MSETPSWLKEPDEETVKKVVTNPVVQSTASSVASDPAVQKAVYDAATKKYNPPTEDVESGNQQARQSEIQELNIDPEELEKMKKYSIALRLSFMVISVLMATAACLKLENASISTAFIALYVFFFSFIMCCFELALKQVAQWLSMNFGFLYTLSGRILFLTFVAVMCFSLGIFGQVVMALTFAGLLFNIYVLVTFPKFASWQRSMHFVNEKA